MIIEYQGNMIFKNFISFDYYFKLLELIKYNIDSEFWSSE